MKILFICGSLDPGRDGVGDYSRRFSGELIQQGHDITILALYDEIVTTFTNELQESEDSKIAVLRIPKNTDKKKRFHEAGKYIADFDPDWLSLQFVPFSFQKKGLPFRLANQLAKIGKGRNWHIMYHELWVEPINSKRAIICFLQKKIIKDLDDNLVPKVTHTTIPIYKLRLNSIGIVANNLNLFSNIPVSTHEQGIAFNTLKLDEEVFKICFFSQITHKEEVFLFIDQLINDLIKHNLKFQIILLGGIESSMKAFANKLEENPMIAGNIIRTGHLDKVAISLVLKQCHLGISPVPRQYLGKSGSAIAFLTHGVPVAAPNAEKQYISFDNGFFESAIFKSILLKPDITNLRNTIKSAKAVKAFFSIESIARKYISDLNN